MVYKSHQKQTTPRVFLAMRCRAVNVLRPLAQCLKVVAAQWEPQLAIDLFFVKIGFRQILEDP